MGCSGLILGIRSGAFWGLSIGGNVGDDFQGPDLADNLNAKVIVGDG